MHDRALTFTVDGTELVGIVTTPAAPEDGTFGVLVVVGGPQYRVGSHRQFVHLARTLAAAGIPAMRFDFAGMGDSDGAPRAFDARSHEIRAAIDAFFAAVPGLAGIALWGLCDGASAALFAAAEDPRVQRLVLLNPWVRTEEGLARTHMRHHYAKNVASVDFWKRLVTGRVHVLRSVREFVATWQRSRAGSSAGPTTSFQERMALGWKQFRGPILLVLSGDDLTAREFEEFAARDGAWSGLVDEPRVVLRRLPEADHTFSCAAWRDDVATLTVEWLVARELAHAG